VNDPRRLLDGDATPLESCLLEAGRAETPPADVSLAMASALGLGAGPVLVGDVVGSAGASASGGSAAGGTATVAATAGGALKWFGAVAAAGLVAGGLVVAAASVPGSGNDPGTSNVSGHVTEIDSQPAPSDSSRALGERESVNAPAPAVEGDATQRTQASDDVPSPRATPVAAARAPATTKAASNGGRARPVSERESVGDVAAEVKLLDGARRALERGDRAAALRQLGRYDARFSQGVLKQEAAVLRRAARASGSTRE